MSVVLALNCGSSSLRFALFDGEAQLAAGLEQVASERGPAAHAAAIHAAFDALASHPRPAAVGHRVVHGGPLLSSPTRIDDAVLATLREVRRFAPLHMPIALAAIEAVRARDPALPQVACFDTGFHRNLPRAARTLPVPATLEAAGVRRYGFHGLSYESVIAQVPAKTLGRAVIAHLGSGASMCAVRGGRSVDTTMGLTPAGGIVMGTRTGDLDPGVLLFALDHLGYSPTDLDGLVNREGGLLGISGLSSDMRTLLASKERRARLAVEIFCREAAKRIGAFTAVLAGIDTLVFTGGIGEHASEVRARICAPLGHLGIHLDPARNASGAEVISASGSACTVRVVPAREERMIARHTAQLLER